MKLRVSNDEINEQFCISWLKANYEFVIGKKSIIVQQDIYKHYLTSLHKLFSDGKHKYYFGKKDILSLQYFDNCVRCVNT